MKKTSVKYLIFAICALLLLGTTGLARETNVPSEPLVVPLGEPDEFWEMDDLAPGKPGGEVKYSTEKFPGTFNDLLGREPDTKDVTKMIMGAGLVDENPVNGKLVPAFAKSWSLSDDGRVYTFHLRTGLKFSDGRPLTAEDVAFTYEELVFNPKVKTERRAILRIGGELPKVTVVDRYTIKFEITEPHGPFLRRLSTGIYPKHELKDVTGEEFNDTWNREFAANNPENIVGAGPFRLDEFVPGEKIILSRNPYYYKVDPRGTQLPYLERYKILKVKDNDVEFLKFRSGETDFLRPQIRDMPYLLSHADEEGWNLLEGDGTRSAPLNADFVTFNWNTEEGHLKELFREPDFRRAVFLAIDLEEIINRVFNGFGRPQYGPISRLSPYHNPEVGNLLPVEPDPESARKLLGELGLKDRDGDGVRETASGDPISFSILVNEENRVRAGSARIITRNLADLGLEVEVETVQFDNYTSKLVNGNYQSTIASVLANSREPSTLSDVFTSGGPLHLWNRGQNRTLTEWEKEIDRLFTKGLQAGSFEERKEYYDKFQSIYAEQLPVIYLAGESFLYATAPSIRNWQEFNRLGTFLDFAEFIWLGK